MNSPTSEPKSLPIVSFGDALIDMLQAKDIDGQFILRPFPGGAPANVAAGVARLSGVSYFAGGVGADSFGELLKTTLSDVGVDISMMLSSELGPTGLAVVTLDETSGERQFAFYRHNAAYSHFSSDHFNDDVLEQAGFFHFVSNIISEPLNQEATRYAVDKVKQSGGLISFDVNYRPGFWDEDEVAKSTVLDFLNLADIIKISEEELDWLEPNKSEQETLIKSLCKDAGKVVILSLGENGARFYSQDKSTHVDGFKAKAVDATAAGDSFISGILTKMAEAKLTRANISKFIHSDNMVKAIRFGCACGAITVSRYGAIPSLPSLEEANDLFDQ